MTLVEFLKGIADAIRTRKETTAPINAQNFAAEILTLGPKFESIDITENGEYEVEDYKVAKVLVPTGDTAIGLIQRDVTEYNIPYGVTKVGDSAFRNFKTLTKVTIPETVVQLERDAFNGCNNLENVNLPTSIKTVGYTCFSGAYTSFPNGLPSGLVSIDGFAFQYCQFGDELIIPESVTTLVQYSLAGIKAKSVIFLANVTSIPQNCFENMEAENVTLSNTVTKIEKRAFSASKIKSVVLPESLTEIDTQAFTSCEALTEVTIPANVTTIGESAFYQCRGLKKAVLNEGLTSLGSVGFGYSGLEEVNIPRTLSVLNPTVFSYTKVKTFFIPATITQIGSSALNSTATGFNIVMESATPCTLNVSPFSTSYLGKIYVPKGSGAIYRSATNWSAYADYIVETSSINVVVPNEMLNNETYLYSIDNSETWHQFSETSFTIENAGIITFKNASADTTLLIGTTAGGDDVATISNAETEYRTEGDATLYFTIA